MKLFLVLALLPLLTFAEAPKKAYSTKYKKHFYLGLKKHPVKTSGLNKSFLKADVKVPNDFYMPEKWPLPPGLPYDQGQCGSCVVNSIDGQATYQLAIRGLLPLAVSPLSRGQVMNCNPTAGQCNGDWAENVGGWVVKHGKVLPESAYPYSPRNGTCRNVQGTEYGPFVTGGVIDNSPESMGKALVMGVPLSITVGAGGAWMDYESGTFTSCSNVGTNHEVLLIGIHCKNAAKGADGYCNFAAAKPGDIVYDILNSWGMWGDAGIIHTVATDRNGRRCNNVAEEAYALDTGIPIPSEKPVSCSLKVEPTSIAPAGKVKATLSTQGDVFGAVIEETAVSFPEGSVELTAPITPGFQTVHAEVTAKDGKNASCETNYTVLPVDPSPPKLPWWGILTALAFAVAFLILRSIKKEKN
jgi:hypothetical protein